MNKLPLEILDDDELTAYLKSKSIKESEQIINLIRRYGITDTINPMKKLLSNQLNTDWKHVYHKELEAKVIYDNFMLSKSFNRLLFKELDEFERLFTHQLMNTYLENYKDLNSIIDVSVKDQIDDENINIFIDKFINGINNIRDEHVYTNYIYSFFNNSINKNDSSLNKKIRLFKILNSDKQIIILNNVNSYGNFNFALDVDIISSGVELNAINNLRNIVCHNNSMQYRCYEIALKSIYLRLNDHLSKENVSLKSSQKIIKNLAYSKSLVFRGLKVLNRTELHKKSKQLQFEQIFTNTRNVYNSVLYKEFQSSETVEIAKHEILNKMSNKEA